MKYHPLELLQQIEDKWGLDMPEKSEDRIKFLKREFKFLDIFRSLQGFTDLCSKLDIAHKVQDLFQDAAVDLKKVNKIQHVDRVASQLQDKLQMIKLEIKAECTFPKKTSYADPKFVMEFIDTVIGNLGDLVPIYVSTSLIFVPGSKKELGDVFNELKLLRNFVCFVSERCIEPHSQHTNFFAHVLVVVGHAAMIAWLYLPTNGNENAEMNVLLSDLLHMKIKPIRPDIRKIYIDVLQALRLTTQSHWHPIIQIEHAADCGMGFVETLQHNLKELPNWIVASTDQIAVFEEILGFLLSNLIHLSIQDLEFHLQDIDVVMVDSGLLVYSLYEDVALGELTLDLPGSIQRIKTVTYHIIRKEFQSNLPRIHGIGYVDFLLNNLREFQDRYSDSLDFLMTELQKVQTELEKMQDFLRSAAEGRHNNHDKLQHSVSLLIGKAYEVEYIIDGCVSQKVPKWCLMLWLLDIIEEIGAEVAESQKMVEVNLVSRDTMDTSHTSSVLRRTQRIDEEIIGFEVEMERLRCQLIGGPKELDVVSIVGMPGAGKTTLAKRLYSDKSVASHFKIRAHCYVSSVYSRRELLLSILAMLPVSNDQTPLSNDESDLAHALRKILHSGRYLILVDDVWDAKAWDDLKLCFPNANNGSRILLSTRRCGVATYAKSVSEPLHLRLFNDSESWKLLKSKVIGEASCSFVLEKVGQKIAKKCGGLPLSIVFLASRLAKMEKTEQCWKQVARSLGSDVHYYPEDIIEQSYQNLPYPLKSCFLYFGIFSNHKEINISKLTLLWIGEGFVKDDENKSLEDIAEGYLKNLVESNLVMVAKRSCGDKIKVCRIHDILLNFCKARAHKEKLIQRIERYQKDIYLPKQLAQRRLAFYAKVDDLVQWSSSCSLVGSVLFREASINTYSSIAQASNIFHNFKFLKVLNLGSSMIDSFPTELAYLRYFVARTSQESITSSIANLWNLETMIVNRMEGYLSLPITIWKMFKLRHLHISPCFTSEEFLDDSSKLYNLVTFSTPYFSSAEDAELMLKKTPNIRELRCKFKGVSSGHFPVLHFPTQLEILDIFGDQLLEVLPYLVCIAASNLKKLKVSRFRLGVQHLSNIAQLQNLQELELSFIEFEDKEWEVTDSEFPQLKVLKLKDCSSLKEWTVMENAFPSLEHLVLHDCKLLNKIPSYFEEVSSLKSIEVWGCSESVSKSASDIKEKQVEEYQNAGFDIFFHKRENTNSDSELYDDDVDDDIDDDDDDDDDDVDVVDADADVDVDERFLELL